MQRAMASPEAVLEGLGELEKLDSRQELSRARYVADHIAGASFVELPGIDVARFYETPENILDRIEEFVGCLE